MAGLWHLVRGVFTGHPAWCPCTDDDPEVTAAQEHQAARELDVARLEAREDPGGAAANELHRALAAAEVRARVRAAEVRIFKGNGDDA